MTITTEQIKEKIQKLIDWYEKGSLGMSFAFNQGRLSGLIEIRGFIQHEEEAPEGCPEWCENPMHKPQEPREGQR